MTCLCKQKPVFHFDKHWEQEFFSFFSSPALTQGLTLIKDNTEQLIFRTNSLQCLQTNKHYCSPCKYILLVNIMNKLKVIQEKITQENPTKQTNWKEYKSSPSNDAPDLRYFSDYSTCWPARALRFIFSTWLEGQRDAHVYQWPHLGAEDPDSHLPQSRGIRSWLHLKEKVLLLPDSELGSAGTEEGGLMLQKIRVECLHR